MSGGALYAINQSIGGSIGYMLAPFSNEAV